MDGAIAPHAPAGLEQAAGTRSERGVFVARGDDAALVVVRAALQPRRLERAGQAELTPDRVDDPRPLPIRQHGRVEARVVGF